MMKIPYEYYESALGVLRRFYGHHGITIEVISERPVQVGVNWAAIGTVDADKTEEFARLLMDAADGCRKFPFNGFYIERREDD